MRENECLGFDSEEAQKAADEVRRYYVGAYCSTGSGIAAFHIADGRGGPMHLGFGYSKDKAWFAARDAIRRMKGMS